MAELTEEQNDELEVLACVYMEDFKPDPENRLTFKIALDSDRVTEGRDASHLEVTFTEKYPEEPPVLRVLQSHMMDKSRAQLEKKLHAVAEESLGAVMVMTLVQAARDWLEAFEAGDILDADEEEALASEQERLTEACGKFERLIAKAKSIVADATPPAGQPTPIFDFVYLGGVAEARNAQMLRNIGITHVLNVASREAPSPSGSTIVYKEIAAQDDDDYDLLDDHLQEAIVFIEGARRERGKVFVHSIAGANRSVALVVGYLLGQRRVPILDALRLVTPTRPSVLSNDNFLAQLVRLALTEGLLGDDSDWQ